MKKVQTAKMSWVVDASVKLLYQLVEHLDIKQTCVHAHPRGRVSLQTTENLMKLLYIYIERFRFGWDWDPQPPNPNTNH